MQQSLRSLNHHTVRVLSPNGSPFGSRETEHDRNEGYGSEDFRPTSVEDILASYGEGDIDFS